ncbi:MAG: hypothetical protein RIR95_1897 [Pseudomonadota bacterium]|jgi:hypothetical protein
MHWLRILISAIVATELLLRLPLLPAMKRATSAAQKSGRVLKSKRISDHWKERVLLAYSGRIARNSFGFFAMLCAVVLGVVFVGLSHPGGLMDWVFVLSQPLNLVALCAASLVYAFLRSKLRRG